MNISSQTNISSSVHAEQKTITTEQSSVGSSSKDLAAVTATPSVKVSLSASENTQAASNAVIPALYSRISVSKANTERVYTDSDNKPEAKVSGEVDPVESRAQEKRSESQGAEADRSDEPKGEERAAEPQNNTDRRASDEQEARQEAVEKEQIEALKARDIEVRAHEQAHKAVGGQYAGAISMAYESGPDGKRYAVSGEVPIDVAPIPNDPLATISKMNTVKAAATAPAEPSVQDRAVAAQAARLLSEAQADLAKQAQEELALNKDKSEEKEVSQDKANTSIQEFETIASLDSSESSEIDDVA